MIRYIILIFFFCVLCHFKNTAQYSDDITRRIKEVKEASYYDSLSLFNVGRETIIKASQNEKDRRAIAEVYLHYGSYFYYTRNISRTKFYLIKSIREAEKSQNFHIKTLANIRLIFMDYEMGLNDNAKKDFKILLEETKKIKDYSNTCEILNLMGIMKEENNQPQEAAKLYMEGLVISESHSINHYTAVFRNNLALIKLYTDQTDEALMDFEKALEHAKRENDRNLANHIQINICLIYIAKNKVKDALLLFEEIINYARVNNHPRELAAAFINLGSAFNTYEKKEEALSYTDSAIAVLEHHALDIELTKAYLEKTEVLINLNRIYDARKSLGLAKKLADKTGNLEDKAACFLLLYRAEKEEKNYQLALENFLEYRKIKDSTEKTVNSKIIQELQLKYNVQKKEIELEKEKSKYLLLEKKHQDERFFKWLTIGISLMTLILVISFLYYKYSLKIREKQESFSRQLIENIEEDRLRISMDLHDDIGQSLSIIKSKINVSKNNVNDKTLENELSRVIEQTREISRNLYPSYLEKIGLVRSIARLMENIQSSTHLECSFEVTETVDKLPINIKTHLYRILQECTNNTIKHAQASALKISISEKNNEFILIYQDNGVGLTTKQKNGLGLLSIKERTKIINGTVSFEDKLNKSFKLTLKFNA